MSRIRVEVYRDARVLVRTHQATAAADVAELVPAALRGAPAGSFALVIEVGVFQQDEDVLERWRVAPDGRLLRSRYSVTDTEHEVAR